jgi:hypothetical protein
MADLEWRVQASELEIKRRFEPDRSRAIVRHRTDETEAAVFNAPERVLGLAVKYAQAQEQETDIQEF